MRPPSIRVTILERAAHLPAETRTLLGIGLGARPQFSARCARRTCRHAGAGSAASSSRRRWQSGLIEHGRRRVIALRAHAGSRGISRCACRQPSGAGCMSARPSACAPAPIAEPRFPGPPWPSISRNPARTRAPTASPHGGRRLIRPRRVIRSTTRRCATTARCCILGRCRADRCRACPPAARAGRGADRRRRSRCGAAQQHRGLSHRRVARRPGAARGFGAHLRQHLHFRQRRSAAGEPAENCAGANRRRRHRPPRALAGAPGRGDATGRRPVRARGAGARCHPAGAQRRQCAHAADYPCAAPCRR